MTADFEFSLNDFFMNAIDADLCRIISSRPPDTETIKQRANEQLSKIAGNGVRYECLSVEFSDDGKSAVLDIVEIPTVTVTIPLD